jgi:hypothetical protein
MNILNTGEEARREKKQQKIKKSYDTCRDMRCSCGYLDRFYGCRILLPYGK